MASGHLALSLVRHNQLLLHVRFFGEKLSCVNWLCFILSTSILPKLDLVRSLSEAPEHNHLGVNIVLSREVASLLLKRIFIRSLTEYGEVVLRR